MYIDYYIFWGIFGIVVELCFTAIRDLIFKRKISLVGHASLWMFPVYAIGLTHGFDLIQYIIPNNFLRWVSYPFWIWGIELLIGIPAVNKNIRIWDYSYLSDRFHWNGIISFIHYPAWVGFGILVELIK